MIKKNFIIGIVLSAVCVLQVVTLIRMNELRATVAQFSAKVAIEEIVRGETLDTSTFSSMTKDTYSPISVSPEKLEKPYEDSIISSERLIKEWTGTGYNPEGPVGLEGQTPPVYSDMSNVIGKGIQKGE